MSQANPHPDSKRAHLKVHARWALLLPLLLFAVVAHAHDPFELNAAVYLRSNHIELFLEMEPRPASLLAGRPAPSDTAARLSQLESNAPGLIRLWSGEAELKATSAKASIGMENHTQVRLLYPRPSGSMFRLEAPLLKALESDGSYGLAFTAFDMVNQKVLGQAVLFADAPTVPFPIASGCILTASPSTNPSPTNRESANLTNAPPHPMVTTLPPAPNSRLLRVGWIVAGLGAVAAIAWFNRARR